MSAKRSGDQCLVRLLNGRRELLDLVRDRLRFGGGFFGTFCCECDTCLFISDYESSLVTQENVLSRESELHHVLSWVRLLCDRRGLFIHRGHNDSIADCPANL